MVDLDWRSPAVLVAACIVVVLPAFTQGATTGVACGSFFLLYMDFENHILSPIIIGDAVNLAATTTMVGAIVGVSVAGVPGALVAVPLMGVGKAIYLELRSGGLGPEPVPGPGPVKTLLARLRRRRARPASPIGPGPASSP